MKLLQKHGGFVVLLHTLDIILGPKTLKKNLQLDFNPCFDNMQSVFIPTSAIIYISKIQPRCLIKIKI